MLGLHTGLSTLKTEFGSRKNGPAGLNTTHLSNKFDWSSCDEQNNFTPIFSNYEVFRAT